jgi:outer membrane protein
MRAVVVALMAVLGLMTALPAQAQGSKIGFVNTEQILRESGPAKAAQAKLDAEFKPRGDKLRALQKNAETLAANLQRDRATLSPTEGAKRERSVTLAAQQVDNEDRALRDDYAARHNELLQGIIQLANSAIKKIAEAENYDLIVQDSVTVNPRVDITDKVIQALGR